MIRSRDVIGEFAVESQQLAANRRADHLSQIRCRLDARRGFYDDMQFFVALRILHNVCNTNLPLTQLRMSGCSSPTDIFSG